MGNRVVNDGTPAFPASFRTMADEETRGERIRRLRVARGYTQPALAQALIAMGAPKTLTKAAVAKWESGDTTNIQNETFILLCGALGTDAPYLLWGEDRQPPSSRTSPPTPAHRGLGRTRS